MRLPAAILCVCLSLPLGACHMATKQEDRDAADTYAEHTFGYDLRFLEQKDSVIVLKDGDAQVIVSPKYQGKVFTSTAAGLNGYSFGWINYKALASDAPAAHMNVYGGEDRFWLGPEGGQFSIFFKPGTKMVFDNWQTPAPIDSEPWDLVGYDAVQVTMKKTVRLTNRAGTTFQADLNRQVRLLPAESLGRVLGITPGTSVKWVAFETVNGLTNTGDTRWTKQTGTLCIWILAMLKPVGDGVAVIPYSQGDDRTLGPVAATNYFGEIPADRIRVDSGILYFKIDGRHRSKLGLSPKRATPLAGSYDAGNKALTIVQFDLPASHDGYVNQLWEVQEEPFTGDVINSYNDGPLEGGGQLGPFYELETSSPAAFLGPGERLIHTQRMFHFIGEDAALSEVSQRVLRVSLERIKSALK